MRKRASANALALVVVALSFASCGLLPDTEPPPVWSHGYFEDVEYTSLMTVVGATIEGEGFPTPRTDPGTGEIESDWAYGTSQRAVRGPSRRKVIAEVDHLEADDGTLAYHVRLRVREEVIRKLGLLAGDVRRSNDWEPFPDNRDDAEFLMTKLQALLRPDERRLSDEFYDRRERFTESVQGP